MFDDFGAFDMDPDGLQDLNDSGNIADMNARNQDVPANPRVPLENGQNNGQMGGMGEGWSVPAEESVPPGSVDWSKSHPGTSAKNPSEASAWAGVASSVIGGASKFVQQQAAVDTAKAQAEINQLNQQKAAADAAYRQRMSALQQRAGFAGSWMSKYGTLLLIGVLLAGGAVYFYSRKRRRNRR